MSIFVTIRWTADDIWRFRYLEIAAVRHLGVKEGVNMHICTKFCCDLSNCCWDVTVFWFFKMASAPSWIFNFLKFLMVGRLKKAELHRRAKFGRNRGPDMVIYRFFDFSRWRPPPSWVFGRPFVKWFALCYRSVVCLSWLSVCNVRALWPNGWTDQDETWHTGRPRPCHIVLDGDPAPPLPKGHSPPPNFRPIPVAAKWLHGSRCQLVWS